MIRDIISKIKIKTAWFCSGFGKSGSILLEIAIAISIIGMVSAFLITKTITISKNMRIQTTRNNIETITLALASFLANNNRLPRPSLDNNGAENQVSGVNLSNFVGNVPFYTLGISSKTALDGNGKPLIYIVEPNLTLNFQSIYETGVDNYFCSGISTSSIVISNTRNLSPDVIAFVIDTVAPSISDKINIKISSNTHWISRDILLMKYLKNCPCKTETPIAGSKERDTFDFF